MRERLKDLKNKKAVRIAGIAGVVTAACVGVGIAGEGLAELLSHQTLHQPKEPDEPEVPVQTTAMPDQTMASEASPVEYAETGPTAHDYKWPALIGLGNITVCAGTGVVIAWRKRPYGEMQLPYSFEYEENDLLTADERIQLAEIEQNIGEISL
jgi:hypothetical protein